MGKTHEILHNNKRNKAIRHAVMVITMVVSFAGVVITTLADLEGRNVDTKNNLISHCNYI